MENATFPIEIFCLIIDNLAKHRPNLQRCSLVCKAFVPICRHHLFNCVSLRFTLDVTRERIAKLAHFLDRDPSIGSYIQRLRASCHSGADYRNAYGPGALTPTVLTALPSHIPHLRHLSLLAWRGGMDYSRCRTEVFGLCMLLDHFLQLQLQTESLQTIQLAGIDDLPMFDILSVNSLTDLTISNCNVQSNVPNVPSIHTPAPSTLDPPELRIPLNGTLKSLYFFSVKNLDSSMFFFISGLENLSIGKTTFADTTPLSPLSRFAPVEPSFNHLRSLRCWGDVDWSRLSCFAAAAGKKAFPVLNVLTMEGGYTGGHVLLDNINVKTLSEIHLRDRALFFFFVQAVLLKLVLTFMTKEFAFKRDPLAFRDLMVRFGASLKMFTVQRAGNEYNEDIPEAVCNALAAIQGRSMLESVSLSLSYPFPFPNQQPDDNTNFAPSLSLSEWRRLADNLSNQSNFPNLNKVTIGIKFHSTNAVDKSSVLIDTFKHLWDEPLSSLMGHSSLGLDLKVKLEQDDY
ncbi:hypothetical protein CVT24_013225 [Panaeolus cyanescens]|uniref:F-box domain-containing protein n=1 Tax=Panaeolus cyanescens TaxID=181874 RepID=A0A409YP41_9AGAR|nr:hypothetical protein CVT24_013225 [Panaeolus cyanescens]